MRDPVSSADGHTYERADIEAWLRNHSPPTGAKLSNKNLIPDIALRQAIEEWQENNGMHTNRANIELHNPPTSLGAFKTVYQGLLSLKAGGKNFKDGQGGSIENSWQRM